MQHHEPENVRLFYLALLPHFVAPSAATGIWLAHALVLPLIGTAWLVSLTVATTRAGTFLLCRAARRTLDATAGVILLGVGGRLATEA